MKPENTPPDIHLSNYEEYLLLSLDGELDADTEAALFAFLDAHPELAGEVAAFEATKVPLPADAPVFENKETLLQPLAAVRKTFRLQPFLWSAAALLLLWIGVRTMQGPPEEAAIVAGVPKTAQPITAPQPAEATNNFPTPAIAQKAEAKEPVLRESRRVSQPRVQTIISGSAPRLAAASPQEDMTTLPIAPSAPLPENPSLPAKPMLVAIALPAPAGPAASTGLEINVPALDALRDVAAEKVLALRDAHRNLKNTEATVFLGKRELFTIRF